MIIKSLKIIVIEVIYCLLKIRTIKALRKDHLADYHKLPGYRNAKDVVQLIIVLLKIINIVYKVVETKLRFNQEIVFLELIAR